MAETMAALWKERAAQPPKFDLISMMAHAEATRDMPMNEFIGNFALLIVGGNDTTRNSMTGGLMAFAEIPGRARQGARPIAGLLPTAGVGDHPLADAGDPHAAHRDARHRACRQGHQAGRQGRDVVRLGQSRRERRSTSPSASSSTGPRRASISSFGAGIHRCVGDRLAELQLQILWRRDAEARARGSRSSGAPVRLYSNFIRGIRSLPVVIDVLTVATPAAKACCSSQTSPAIATKS